MDELEAAALVQPCVLLPGCQAEGHAGVEGQRGVLARVVVAAGLAHLDRAVLDGVHHLQAGDDLAGGVGTDVEVAIGHLRHALGQDLGAAVDGVQAAGKAAGDAPPDLLPGDDRGAVAAGLGVARASRQRGGAGSKQEVSALHPRTLMG